MIVLTCTTPSPSTYSVRCRQRRGHMATGPSSSSLARTTPTSGSRLRSSSSSESRKSSRWSPSARWCRPCVNHQCPAVIIGGTPRHPQLESMSNDDVLGAGPALDHLVLLGHERLTLVAGGPMRSSGSGVAATARRCTGTVREGRGRHGGVVHRGRRLSRCVGGTRPRSDRPPLSPSTTARRWSTVDCPCRRKSP